MQILCFRRIIQFFLFFRLSFAAARVIMTLNSLLAKANNSRLTAENYRPRSKECRENGERVLRSRWRFFVCLEVWSIKPFDRSSNKVPIIFFFLHPSVPHHPDRSQSDPKDCCESFRSGQIMQIRNRDLVFFLFRLWKSSDLRCGLLADQSGWLTQWYRRMWNGTEQNASCWLFAKNRVKVVEGPLLKINHVKKGNRPKPQRKEGELKRENGLGLAEGKKGGNS